MVFCITIRLIIKCRSFVSIVIKSLSTANSFNQ